MKNLLLSAALALTTCGNPAYAQEGDPSNPFDEFALPWDDFLGNCGPGEVIIPTVQSRYGEGFVFSGMTDDVYMGPVTVLQVALNPGTGTWTLFVTTPEGATCILAWGSAGEVTEPIIAEPGDDL